MKSVGQPFVFVLIIVMIGSVFAYSLVVKAYNTYAEVEKLNDIY